MTAPVWPADWHREALIRADRYVALRQLLCPRCGKTGHVSGDCGRPERYCPGSGCYYLGFECVQVCRPDRGQGSKS